MRTEKGKKEWERNKTDRRRWSMRGRCRRREKKEVE
jgi:hypothetical protein